MLEPGVVRFGLGPLTEVVAQRHRFDELAPHLDSSLIAVVAQERVLRGEDLRDDDRAVAAIADSGADVPAVLQAFEPDYALPEYRADTRLDGGFLLPDDGWSGASDASGVPHDDRAERVCVALRACVEPWLSESEGVIELAAVHGGADDVLRTLERRAITTGQLFGLVAFAAASGGARGRRRGAAAGRASAWWVARTAAGLDTATWSDASTDVLADELEFRLEDLELAALRPASAASWSLGVVITDAQAGWSAGISASDLADTGESRSDG